MQTSIYRERFACTMAHQPVDRCPVDLGGTPQSTVEKPELTTALAEYLGLPPQPREDSFDERIMEAFDVDFRRTGALLGHVTGRECRVSDVEFTDAFGMKYRFDGRYWNRVGEPLRDATLDEIAAFELPTVAQVRHDVDALAAHARHLCEQTPYVVAAEHPVFGVLELACWLCGYDDFMIRLASEPETVHLLFGKILAFQKEMIALYYGALGPYIHLTTSGDDFGTQRGLFMSAAMWREYVKPYMHERIAYTARSTDAVYMHHTCGAVSEIIPDLIEIGVGILNPIQPAATNMEPDRLKNAYGDRIVFHGGLDTQEVLPSNDPVHIEAAVRELLAAMRPRQSGGYIFAPAHNIQPDVSPAAIACMYRAALRPGEA